MKKGIIFTVILFIVAGVLAIVFVTLFKDKDTKAVANKVLSVTSEGYLSNGEDREVFEKYLDNMLGKTENDDEIILSISLYATYNRLGEFFRENIVFTSFTNEYKRNKDDIIGGLTNADKKFDEMVSYITTNTAGDNEAWEARTWDDIQPMMLEFIEQNNRAFAGLARIYPSCGDSKVTNNDFTTVLFETIDRYLSSYADAGTARKQALTHYLKNLTTDYLNVELIYGYLYNETWQTEITDILENGTKSIYYLPFITGTL